MSDQQPPERDAVTGEPVDLVDWSRTARRMRVSALMLGALAVLAWLGAGLAGAGLHARGLFGWLGIALVGLLVVEFVVVGGSALRGMLRAGERGERLASNDVGLLPPRRRGPSGDRP